MNDIPTKMYIMVIFIMEKHMDKGCIHGQMDRYMMDSGRRD